jgi:hypothetical protein
MERPARAGCGMAWQARRGAERQVEACRGVAGLGMAGKAGTGESRLVAVLLGWAGEGRLVVEQCGKEVLGMVWQARFGVLGHGGEWHRLAGNATERNGEEAVFRPGVSLEDGSMAGKKSTSENGSWSDQEGRAAKSAEHLAGLETLPPKPARGRAPVAGPIMLPTLDIRTLEVRIVGDSELIVHRWSEKAKKELLDKQMGIASAGREKKIPEQDYWDSLYHLVPGQTFPHKDGYRYGFPTIAFKNASVEACTSLGKSITKVMARQAFHMVGELVEIQGIPHMREDMVRLNGQTADIRFRGAFFPWACLLTIRYNARVLSEQQVVNMLNTAGFACGTGEWRSECGGSFGAFHCE